MHPARLRIHPARPGGGSRASDARPSGRPAPRLPGGPGGDTGDRAPSLPRSFHFESTLRKFAKLVSRWLLSASREGAAHQPAVAAALGGSRWLPRGLGRAAWETGRARRGRELRSRNGWAAPRGSDSGGRLLPGRCAEPAPPLPALSPPPARPRPAPGPAAYCSAPGGGGGVGPGGARLEDLYGDAGAQPGRGWGPGPLPCGLPTHLRVWEEGGGQREPRRERGAGGPGRPLPVGLRLRASVAGRDPTRRNCSAESAAPAVARAAPERAPGPVKDRGGAGGGYTSAKCRRPKCFTPDKTPLDCETHRTTNQVRGPLG